MEQYQRFGREPNPRKEANIFSLLTFAYTIPTFRKGFQRDLQEEDIKEHLQAHDSKKLGDRLEKSWQQELVSLRQPSLWRALGRVFGLEFTFYSLAVIFITLVVQMSQPLALSQLIKYYTQGEEQLITENQAYIYAGIIVGASFLSMALIHHWMLGLLHFGMRMRIAFCSVIYRKSLRLNKSAFGETSVGEIANLLSNDVSRCDRVVMDIHALWLCPLQIIAIVSILLYLLGWTSTLGIAFMASLTPLQMYLGKKSSEFRLKIALRTDERIRLMDEIISGIQVIKMFTWEKPFAKLVAMVRKMEIRYVRATSYVRGVILSFGIFTSRSALFLTILTYVLLGNALSAEYVFVVSSFYDILQSEMTWHFPQGIALLGEFNVSISRLQKFLLYDETEIEENIQTENNITTTTSAANGEPNFLICMEDASAKWLSSSSTNTLNKIDFQAQSGQLVAIVGPVGSGKTSLLHAILKELSLESGSLSVEGAISYASQEPWVFAGSVRQNILFGQRMVQERYHNVVKVCALEQDFVLFPYGDETLVGERGVTLSGGQRARVSLARAIYKEADIYLLDDPLSAVDTHVGKQLFDDCVSTFLEDKCTVLVTHQLQYLQNVDRIYLMENGRITKSGTYQELKKSEIDFTKHLVENQQVDPVNVKKVHQQKSKIQEENNPTEEKELRSSGKVSGDVYMSYFRAGGSLLIGLVVLFLFVATQLAASGAEYFLTYWVNMEQKKSDHNDTEANPFFSTETCIYIYSGITAIMIVFTLCRSFSFFGYCMKASEELHNNMFSNIVRVPMRFFNVNSSGRILNRFSKDIGTIDEILPMVIIDFLQQGLAVFSIIILVAVVNPWMLIVTAVMVVIFCLLRIVYTKTSQSLKRLEGITRSPIFSHMSASLQGLTTIRACRAQAILEKEFDNHQNVNSSVSHWFLSCQRAFAIWLDFICCVYIAAVTFSFFFIKNEQYGGNVGLAITQAMSLMGVFQWVMREWTELENQMTSVERVAEYAKIDPEVDPTENIPPPTWPEEGNINFISVSLRYSSGNLYALKQLNFDIKSKEKIGIVGRTGAGKSSLISALFQLTKTEGAILMDNVDITKIPLHKLRSKISIIPQEPVLFSGAFRKNLDPFDEYPDEDLWKALEEVEMKQAIADLPAGLNSRVYERGSNFSLGQRQLVCLARAILRKNKVLVLDEATANVDHPTDALIQKTIRREFVHCTVLTIAHRLQTIMDSDKVLVMDQGFAIEFDHTHLLLKNENGIFYDLVQQSGIALSETLKEIARKSYQDSR